MNNESKLPLKVGRILVVEDDLDFAFLISVVLRDAGYSVRTSGDASSALDEISRDIPDLITLDLHMPHKSGAQFYVELKSNPLYRDIPVIVITGLRESLAADAVIRSYLAADARPAPVAFFDKPFNRHEFLRTVSACFARISKASRPSEMD